MDRATVYEESEALDLHYYAGLARRYLALLLAIPLVFVLAGYLNADRQTRMYSATAQVLLRPNDPNERLGSATQSASVVSNIEQYVRSQGNLARGPEVRTAAATSLALEPEDLEDEVKVSALVDSNTLEVTATTEDPELSAQMADAVAAAYIDNRKEYARAGLERAIADMTEKLDMLESELPLTGLEAPNAAQEAAMAQYQELAAKINELEIDLNLKNGEAELIADAEVPAAPVSPKPARSAILAGMLGALLAVGFVLLRDRFDNRLRSREEAEALTGMTALGEIPFDKQTERRLTGVAVMRQPDGPLAEAVRSLRVSLRFISLEDPLQVILVTSAMPGDGKSTTSLNLAGSAAKSGLKTLLVSGDLRRPTAEKLVGSMPGPGLVELVTELAVRREESSAKPTAVRRRAGAASATRAATVATVAKPAVPTPLFISEWCHADEENLWVLPAGEPVANPVELLGSVATRDFFDLARQQFDMIIVDTPPVVAVADPVVLSPHVDGVLLVCSLRKTSRHALQRAAELMAAGHGRMLGLVINLTPQKKQYSGYYYTSPNSKIG